jgi:hypothetical protein
MGRILASWVAGPDLHFVYFVKVRLDIGWSVDFPDTNGLSASVLTTIVNCFVSLLSCALPRFALVAAGP